MLRPASGSGEDWNAYNHADWYVQEIVAPWSRVGRNFRWENGDAYEVEVTDYH